MTEKEIVQLNSSWDANRKRYYTVVVAVGATVVMVVVILGLFAGERFLAVFLPVALGVMMFGAAPLSALRAVNRGYLVSNSIPWRIDLPEDGEQVELHAAGRSFYFVTDDVVELRALTDKFSSVGPGVEDRLLLRLKSSSAELVLGSETEGIRELIDWAKKEGRFRVQGAWE